MERGAKGERLKYLVRSKTFSDSRDDSMRTYCIMLMIVNVKWLYVLSWQRDWL